MLQDRPLPHNMEIERQLLGSVFFSSSNFDILLQHGINEESFYSPFHKEIFLTMLNMQKKSVKIDILTVVEYADDMDMIGGEAFLIELMIPTDGFLTEWIKIAKVKQSQREVILNCQNAITETYDNGDIKDVIAKITTNISGIKTEIKKSRETNMIVKSTMEMFQSGIDGDFVIKTHVPVIDNEMTQTRKQMHVLSAFPGIGKTAFALTCIASQIMHDVKCAIFCKESSSEEICGRIVSIYSGIPYITMLTNLASLTAGQMQSLKYANETLQKHGHNLFIRGAGDYEHTTNGISNDMKQIDCQLDSVYVDYLQNMGAADHMKKTEKLGQIEYNIEFLKELFTEFNVAGTVLSQMNRLASNAGQPRMNHLKGSSAIEAEAHIISFLNRDRTKDDSSMQLETQWYSDKTRIISPFATNLMFDRNCAKFTGASRYGKDERPAPNHKALNANQPITGK